MHTHRFEPRDDGMSLLCDLRANAPMTASAMQPSQSDKAGSSALLW